MAEDVQVAGERGWVARDVDNAGYWMLYQGIQHALLAASTRRINDQSVDLLCQRWQDVFNLALENLHIGCFAQIPLCIFDGAGRFLDGNYFMNVAGAGQREGSDAAISVYDLE